MSDRPISEDLTEYPVSILGQTPLLNIYTQITLCFAVSDGTSHSAIVSTLTNGLERLSATLPWIAGNLVNEGSGEGNSGVFKIKVWGTTPLLIVKDLSHEPSIPTMDDLRTANFPFSMLEEKIVAPRNTIPGSSGEIISDSRPVFLIQANFITGGLLLTFVGQHNTMDMTGQGQIIHLFSKACRNEQFTDEEKLSCNLAANNLIPLLDDSYTQQSELARQIIPTHSHSAPNDSQSQPPSAPPKCSWAYFTFSPTSLSSLKSLATETITPPSNYISTDDALSAFIWKSIVKARVRRLSPATESTFGRAVDVRRYMGISSKYPGLLQNMTYSSYSVQQLVEEPLGSIASQLRYAVDPRTSNLDHNTRTLATLLDRTPDKITTSFSATIDLSAGLMLSSWAKLDCYDLDFNLNLGKPESVRRPQFIPYESLIYLMPRSLDGEIAVGICLRDEDMQRLRVDEEFIKYGRYIG